MLLPLQIRTGERQALLEDISASHVKLYLRLLFSFILCHHQLLGRVGVTGHQSFQMQMQSDTS